MPQRCSWVSDDPIYIAYHDQEWGKPVFDDRQLFAMLCLEGAQAGLSWISILRRRTTYFEAFDNFDAELMAAYDEAKVERLLQNEGIIRNRLKINVFISNARAYKSLIEEKGSFSDYVWELCRSGQDGQESSQLMSKALKSRGFTFVGPTICYAFMQAVGMVNDHEAGCFLHDRTEN